MAYQTTIPTTPQFMIYPKRRSSKQQEADIYMRISYDINQVEKSLGVKIGYESWDTDRHQVINQPVHALAISQKAEEFKQKVMGAFYMLTKQGGQFTLREIVDNAFEESGGKTYSLMGVFQNVILNMEKQLKADQSKSNLGKHRTCLDHLKTYLKDNYGMRDIGFSKINRSFIDNFETFLKTEVGNNHNSAMKMMQIFKKVYKIAVDNRWTANNAFAGKRISFLDVEMPYLTAKEIATIENFPFKNERLDFVRDIFVFCCYTGLAYIDLKTLQRRHIEYSPISKQYFIKKNRQKTNQPFIIPIFPPAAKILEKRSNNWKFMPNDANLMPILSNQKYNNYLKEVAAFCGIEKHMTTHLARHSFATTVILENGVSLESTSKMMGHSKISQTQKYAKVTEMKIEKETRNLFLQLQ